jgi:hypothetical protein
LKFSRNIKNTLLTTTSDISHAYNTLMNTANAMKQGTIPTKNHRWTTTDKEISESLAYEIKTAIKIL